MKPKDSYVKPKDDKENLQKKNESLKVIRMKSLSPDLPPVFGQFLVASFFSVGASS